MNVGAPSHEASTPHAGGPTPPPARASSKENKENSASNNKPRYMQMTAGEKQRRQSMLVKPVVSTANVKKRAPQDKGGSGLPRPPKHDHEAPLSAHHHPSVPPPPLTPTESTHHAERQGADHESTPEAEVMRLTAELRSVKEENVALKGKLSMMEKERDELRRALQADGRGEGSYSWQSLSTLRTTQGGEEERLSVQDTVGAYCRETDERMRKLHQLIDKLQTHLQLQPASN